MNDPTPNDVRTHTRVNQTFLSFLERPALKWLSARMPRWVTPDLLTGIGFFAAVLIGVGYWLCRYSAWFLWLASFGFLLNWFGDSLDGTLARFRKIERPKYGFFIDHAIDALVETIVIIGLGASPYVSLTIGLIALVGYLLVTILVFMYTYVSGVFRISYGNLGPTELRLIAIIANTVVFFVGNPIIHLPFVSLKLYDTIVCFIILLEIIFFSYIFFSKAHELSKLEAKPPRK
jgi:archaetidylinositol phosphate synthase